LLFVEEAQVPGERRKTVVGRRFSSGNFTLELECEPCADGDDANCGMDTW
jgi:hypothetical protein